MQRFGQVGIGGLANSLVGRGTSSLQEVEEESNPNVNNGLPRVRYFQDISRNVSEVEQFFFLFQMTEQPTKKERASLTDGTTESVMIKKYKIDTMLNHTVIFYNRTLISRA